MTYEFLSNESRIDDFLQFPRLVFVWEQHKSRFEEEMMDKVASQDYLEFVESMRETLDDRQDTINQYYNRDIFADHDFIQVLTHAVPVIGYDDERHYLDALLSMEDRELKQSFKQAITEINEDEDFGGDDDHEKSVPDDDHLIDYINDLNIDPGLKWNLMMMVQNTKTYVTKYVRFMEGFYDLFERHYLSRATDLEKIGRDMEERLNENPSTRLKEITRGNVDIETLGADTVYVLISVFYPYSMRIIGYPQTAMIVWGKDMEKSFEAIAEYQEDKLNQRVKVFKALGDKTRYEVLKLLASGVGSTKAIAEEVGVSSATVSYHLNEFLTNGLISLRQKGRRSGYLINYERLDDIIEEFKADLNFNQTKTED